MRLGRLLRKGPVGCHSLGSLKRSSTNTSSLMIHCPPSNYKVATIVSWKIWSFSIRSHRHRWLFHGSPTLPKSECRRSRDRYGLATYQRIIQQSITATQLLVSTGFPIHISLTPCYSSEIGPRLPCSGLVSQGCCPQCQQQELKAKLRRHD
jgi:hypothetical protein